MVTLILMSMLSAGKPDTGVAPIVLKAEPLPFTPKEFYVASVVDERARRKTMAHIIPAPTPGIPTSTTAVPVDLQGGGFKSVQNFISKGLRRNESLRPVVIRLKECQVTEAPAEKGRVEGRAVVAMVFELQSDGETIPLTEYKGGIKYNRPASQLDAVEPALRQSLTGALSFFNTWIEKEAKSNPRLAKSIKVFFNDYEAASAADTVFYSPVRPLNWDDFVGSPSKPSKYAAAIFPSFSYEGRTEVVDGILHLYLDMKVYMLQSSSWVRPGSKDGYSLNHEQKHFDLAKLVAERFKQKITPDILTVADYNSIIQYHYIESFREMNQLQEQYDAETQHGLNQAAQEKWNKKIAEELNKL
ncbi:hypothetical protein PKOR_19130 [Pontibacter korlensis]|uniref:DUF922 domain-containing protein n=1 Tax=Pontibacter korlensis TaxID=400092 RepID=A0A0E3V020_9BACT|nr:hypothetical protein PKOR_19130 [Pontibacter korlensis]